MGVVYEDAVVCKRVILRSDARLIYICASVLSFSALHRTLTRLSFAWQSCDSFSDLTRTISGRPCSTYLPDAMNAWRRNLVTGCAQVVSFVCAHPNLAGAPRHLPPGTDAPLLLSLSIAFLFCRSEDVQVRPPSFMLLLLPAPS